MINAQTGSEFTRNAMIGKRMRLSPPLPDRGFTLNRSSWAKHQRGEKKIRVPRRPGNNVTAVARTRLPPNFRTEPLPPPHETDVARVSFIDMENDHCRFIIGEPAGPYIKQFCGLERITGSPYCASHHVRCNGPAPVRQHAIRLDRVPILVRGASKFALEEVA